MIRITITIVTWPGTGASAIPYDLGPIDIGKARRTGQTVSPNEDTQGFPQAQFAPDVGATTSGNGAAAAADMPAAASGAMRGNGASTSMSMESQVTNLECGSSETNLAFCFCNCHDVCDMTAISIQHTDGIDLVRR